MPQHSTSHAVYVSKYTSIRATLCHCHCCCRGRPEQLVITLVNLRPNRRPECLSTQTWRPLENNRNVFRIFGKFLQNRSSLQWPGAAIHQKFPRPTMNTIVQYKMIKHAVRLAVIRIIQFSPIMNRN